jgi:hypothetical protein
MKLRTRLTLSLLLSVTAMSVHAEATYLSGRISNVTSASDGLFVMLETGVPTNCTGVGYGWMKIPETNKTMIALALLVWQNKGGVVVYTNALSGGQCVINQFDPWES